MTDQTPFISGCYIVKDEEEFLARSLEALRPFVDELVVYDTGSTDRTVQIARESGARVVEGFWDDDFGAARNRAATHCRGEWILSADADEVAGGDPRALRRFLRLTDGHAFAVEIVSDAWGGAGGINRALVGRVMRRSHCTWKGQLHEQIIGRWGSLGSTPQVDHVVFEHHGYTQVMMRERNKGGRNLTLAERALTTARERGQEDLDQLLVNAGRSATLANQPARGLELFDQMDLQRTPRWLGILAASAAISCATSLGDPDRAEVWLKRLRAWGENEQLCLAREGEIAIARGDFAAAEKVLRTVKDANGVNGLVVEASACTDLLISAIARQGRAAEAAELMLEHTASGLINLPPLGVVLHLNEVPGTLDRLAQVLPAELERPFLAGVQECLAEVANPFLDAMWRAGRTRAGIVAAVSKLHRSLSFEQGLEWSLRFREQGLSNHCPLRGILRAAERDLRTRLLSGAVLVEIGEEDALPVLEALLSAVGDADTESILAELQQVAPQFAASLVPA